MQLTAPDAAKVEVCLAVIVDEAGWVDAVRSLDRFWIWLERSLWLVTDCHPNAEDAFLVPGRKVEVVLAVLLGGVRSPELLRYPLEVVGLESDAVICDLAINCVH